MHQENELTTQTWRQNVLKYKSSTQKGFYFHSQRCFKNE